MATICCVACGEDISSSRTRRLLANSVAKVVAILQEVLEAVSAIDASKLEGCFICRPCFRALEKIYKLREDATSAFKDACDKAMQGHARCVGQLNTSADAGQDSPSHVATHDPQASADTDLSPPPPKRQCQHLPSSTRNSNSPAVSVTIEYKKPVTYALTPSWKKLCKSITRGSHVALARRCINNPDIKKCIIKEVCKILCSDIAALCSDSTPSILQNKSNKTLKSFEWKQLMTELEVHAPTLLQILESCTKFKKPSRHCQEAIIGVITGILCKNHRHSVSLVQRLISILLYSGHASKMAYERLQKLQLCMSHRSTIRLMDEMGTDFDSKVLEWKNVIERELMPSLHLMEGVTPVITLPLPDKALSITSDSRSSAASAVIMSSNASPSPSAPSSVGSVSCSAQEGFQPPEISPGCSSNEEHVNNSPKPSSIQPESDSDLGGSPPDDTPTSPIVSTITGESRHQQHLLPIPLY